jgi:hypothetical protein
MSIRPLRSPGTLEFNGQEAPAPAATNDSDRGGADVAFNLRSTCVA